MTDAPAPAPTADLTPTPPAPPAPTTPWYEGKADAEIIGHWDNKGWKKDDPAAIALEATKAARELQRHFGVPADQLLKLPKESDDVAWNAVHQRLGKPADAKEYDFSGVKFPDGADLEPAFADTMRAALHKANVAKAAAPDVVKAVVKHLADADAAAAAELKVNIDTARAALAKEWGTKPESLDSHPNMAYARIGAQRLGIPPEAVAALENQVGYAGAIEALRKVGAGTREDTFVSPGQAGNVATVNGALARIEELKTDKAFVERYNRGDRAAVNELQNLLIMVHGSAA